MEGIKIIMSYEELAIAAYKRTHKDAPADVPKWEDLHDVERKFLIEFAGQVSEFTKTYNQ